jgi:hypothetical protein
MLFDCLNEIYGLSHRALKIRTFTIFWPIDGKRPGSLVVFIYYDSGL